MKSAKRRGAENANGHRPQKRGISLILPASRIASGVRACADAVGSEKTRAAGNASSTGRMAARGLNDKRSPWPEPDNGASTLSKLERRHRGAGSCEGRNRSDEQAAVNEKKAGQKAHLKRATSLEAHARGRAEAVGVCGASTAYSGRSGRRNRSRGAIEAVGTSKKKPGVEWQNRHA